MDSLRSKFALFFLILFCLILVSYGCGRPPTQEIADAEVALSAARDAGAQIYAAEQYESAESKLEKARNDLEKYHYTNARKMAIEAKDTALSAKQIAEEAMEKHRIQAFDALQSAKEAMKAAKTAGAKENDPEGYGSLEALIAEADTAYISKNYPVVIEKSEEAKLKARRLELAAKRALELKKDEAEKAVIKETQTEYNSHTVQEGECLWIISEYERVYANPFMWPLIYKANRLQIKDPDLIFPGQIFQIPRDVHSKDVESAIHKAKNRGHWSLFDGK